MNTDVWNERYSKPEYAYGNAPNEFLKDQLQKLKSGTILFPAEGEGRNAVFAASLGWNVKAFDQSPSGKKKADQLAKTNTVTIDYVVCDGQKFLYTDDEFDTIALIYAHFPGDIKSKIHKQLVNFLKPGGIVIFEAFSKNHLKYNSVNPAIGGPKDLATLFSLEEISSDFDCCETLLLDEKEIELHEGLYHNGLGSVIRFVGRKK